jgi:hypothetical protein
MLQALRPGRLCVWGNRGGRALDRFRRSVQLLFFDGVFHTVMNIQSVDRRVILFNKQTKGSQTKSEFHIPLKHQHHAGY